MDEKKFLHCELCGNLVGVIEDSGQIPVCCGQKMTLLTANSSDGAGEKHVPAITRDGKTVTVKVGEVEHPMLEKHYIQWISLVQGSHTQRVALKPGEAPVATFVVDSETEPVAAYEYCNLHGLWVAKA